MQMIATVSTWCMQWIDMTWDTLVLFLFSFVLLIGRVQSSPNFRFFRLIIDLSPVGQIVMKLFHMLLSVSEKSFKNYNCVHIYTMQLRQSIVNAYTIAW